MLIDIVTEIYDLIKYYISIVYRYREKTDFISVKISLNALENFNKDELLKWVDELGEDKIHEKIINILIAFHIYY